MQPYAGLRLTEDLEVLARTIFGEARGERFLGQVAVGYVIKNRSLIPGRYGHGIASVCLRKKQFSCWNEDDPNAPIASTATVATGGFLTSLGAAAIAMAGSMPDPTGGATHYHHVSIKPYWVSAMRPTVRIGHHQFYADPSDERRAA